MISFKETDLFEPVKIYFELRGYTIKAEVKHIDIMAVKNETTLAIELKRTLSLDLIYQAIERQRYIDIVYVAIPKTAIKQKRKYKHFTHLLRRLEVGLLLIDNQHVIEVIAPKPYSKPHSKAVNKAKRTRVLNEFQGLTDNSNIGGTKGKTMTLYKEQVETIRKLLSQEGPLKVSVIKDTTQLEKTASILQKNHHGYFVRTKRGIYDVTEVGKQTK